MRMLEQVRGLRVDLERILAIQQIHIEPLLAHLSGVLQPATTQRPGALQAVLPAAGFHAYLASQQVCYVG
jgi:hypothetical protein